MNRIDLTTKNAEITKNQMEWFAGEELQDLMGQKAAEDCRTPRRWREAGSTCGFIIPGVGGTLKFSMERKDNAAIGGDKLSPFLLFLQDGTRDVPA
jgi:hypothetical protein